MVQIRDDIKDEYMTPPLSAITTPRRDIADTEEPNTNTLKNNVAYLVELPSTSNPVADNLERQTVPA